MTRGTRPLKLKDGDKVGRWTIVKAKSDKNRRLADVRCDCGTEKSVSRTSMHIGTSLSCGCWSAERASIVNATHRMTGTPEYIAWSSMKDRCNDPLDKGYYRYGGRGIRVCDEWMESFASFMASVGPRPGPEYSIDRINNDGNYEPGNCRWATRKEQCRNRSSCRMLTYLGRTQSLIEWTEELDLSYNTVKRRLLNGFDVAMAFQPGRLKWRCRGDNATP